MRPALWLFAIVFLTLAGASSAGTLRIKNAEIWGETMFLQLDFAANADVLEALDASVPLKFELRQRNTGAILVQNFAEQTIVLSYAPLLERFELITNGNVRPYRLRAELIDAFSNLQVTARPGATEVRVSLTIGLLPAPLRLPALLDTDWWLDSGWVKIAQSKNLPSDDTAAATPQ